MKNEAELHQMSLNLGLAKPVNTVHAAEVCGAIKAVRYILGMSTYGTPEDDWEKFLKGWEHTLVKK